MSFAPKQNWPAYRLFVESSQIENEHSRSPLQTHQRYAEIYAHVRSVKGTGEPIRSSVELDEKLALRKRLLVAWRLVAGATRE